MNSISNNKRLIAAICLGSSSLGAFALASYLSKAHRRGNADRSKVSGQEASRDAQFILDQLRNVSVSRRKQIDINFLRQILLLMKILVPKIFSKTILVIFFHSSTLFLRSLLSIAVARIEGLLVKSIVQQNAQKFGVNLLYWMGIAVPASFVNSLIRYFESKLAMIFRSRLVNVSYNLYFDNNNFYKVSNLDNRLSNPDQCLTEDIGMFCQHLAHLYSSISKPILDIIIGVYSLHHLSDRTGTSQFVVGPYVVGLSAVAITALLLRAFQPRFGDIIAEEARRKGQLRFAHSKVITNSEEIAFYNGGQAEHTLLKEYYRKVVEQLDLLFKKRLGYVFLEQFLLKYGWSFAGMLMVAIPIIGTRDEANDVERRTQAYTVARNLLITIADAIERIMSSYKELSELSGYTSRVCEMFQVLAQVHQGQFHKSTEAFSKFENKCGKVIESKDILMVEGVPIITPAMDEICDPVTIKFTKGQHVLITGPNGCGKSSLFRIIGGLWPLRGGTLYKANNMSMFYIPQKPYMTTGTLRQQVIYPDMEAKFSDEQLWWLMDVVRLRSVIQNHGGWDAQRDWMEVLSGGEKQRVAMARVFYHKPDFALLDECTSAVSVDVEGAIYQALKDEGITLLTITHRPSLWPFHSHILKFDGNKNWTFSELELPETET